MTDNCPIWGCDLRDKPIPQEYIDAGMYPSGATHYYRTIGHVIPGVYDGVAFWSCPECGGAWHRWPEGSRVRAAVDAQVESINAAAVVR